MKYLKSRNYQTQNIFFEEEGFITEKFAWLRFMQLFSLSLPFFLTVVTKEMDLVFVKMVGNQIIAVYQLKLVCLTIFCLKKKNFLLDKGQCE